MRETRPASDLPPWAGNELGKVHPGGASPHLFPPGTRVAPGVLPELSPHVLEGRRGG